MRFAKLAGSLATAVIALGAPEARAATLAGTVSSGAGASKVAIGSATVTIYQAEERGPRTLASTVSDASGLFTAKIDPRPRGGIVYAIARVGGSVELVTLIGTPAYGTIVINEMTTVASAYALARVTRNGQIPASPMLPAQIAVGMAHKLVAVDTGLPSSTMTTSPNADQTNAWRLLGTLSNLLAPCVRQASSCAQLLALTTSAGEPAPQTTFQAITAVARHPAARMQALFDYASQTQAYVPFLAAEQGPASTNTQQRLDAFTLAIKVNATGTTNASGQEVCPFGGTANVAFDLDGTAWVTNNTVQGTPNSTRCMVVLKPDGSPSDGTDGTPVSPLFGGGVLGQAFGLGFDPKGTIWSGNFGWGSILPTNRYGQMVGSVSRFTRRGRPLSPDYGFIGKLYRAQGIVSDRRGNIIAAAFGNNIVQAFLDGEPRATRPIVYQNSDTLPFDVRVGPDNSPWVSYNGTQAVIKFQPVRDGTRALQPVFRVSLGATSSTTHPEKITGGPKGIALDRRGSAWVAHGDDNALYLIDGSGNKQGPFGGGGLNGPWGVSLDGDQTVWASNFGPFKPTSIKFRISNLCGTDASKCPAGLKTGDPISPETGYTLPSAGQQVLLHSGDPLYGPGAPPSYDPLMRMTAVNTDAAGNVWCMNNWKPDWANDIARNPGGDGVVIFVGLAAPVQPLLYSAPARSPFDD